MLELTPEALAYFQTMPQAVQAALDHSNLTFRTVDDLKDYEAGNPAHLGEVLYQTLPEPAVPSNAALDPLDAADP